MKKVNRLINYQVFLFSLSFLLFFLVSSLHLTHQIRANNSIEVHTIMDLDKIRDCLTCDYILMSDLDLSSATQDIDGTYYHEGLGWNPIATFANPFEGSFDGNGYTINGLMINRSQNYVGLFGRIAKTTNRNKTIKNLILENVNIVGNDYVGGIAGNIEYAQVRNISISGSIQGRMYVGGITGYSYYTKIERVYSIASVKGVSTGIGGVIGRLGRSSEVRDVHVKGQIGGEICGESLSINCSVGGIVGRDESSSIGIFTSFFTGQLIHEIPSESWINPQKHAQPIIGLSYGSAEEFNYHTISSTFFTKGYISEQELLFRSSFVGFNFEYIWEIADVTRLKDIHMFQEPEAQIVRINIVELPYKTEYQKGEDISIEGLKVMIEYDDQTYIELSDFVFFGDTENTGNQIITIAYLGFSDTYVVYVYEPIIPFMDLEEFYYDFESKRIVMIVTSNLLNNSSFLKFRYNFDDDVEIIDVVCGLNCQSSINDQELIIQHLSENGLSSDSLKIELMLDVNIQKSREVIFDIYDIKLSQHDNIENFINKDYSLTFYLDSNYLEDNHELPNTSNANQFLLLFRTVLMITGFLLIIISQKKVYFHN